MGNATRKWDANVADRTNVAASNISDRDAAERFSERVTGFTAAQLAKAARRTKAAAKGWKDASRAPGSASLINMARSLPSVRDWLLEEIGAREVQSNSVDGVIRALCAIGAGHGAEAHRARAIIAMIHTPAEQSERREECVVRDLFEQRRRA